MTRCTSTCYGAGVGPDSDETLQKNTTHDSIWIFEAFYRKKYRRVYWLLPPASVLEHSARGRILQTAGRSHNLDPICLRLSMSDWIYNSTESRTFLQCACQRVAREPSEGEAHPVLPGLIPTIQVQSLCKDLKPPDECHHKLSRAPCY